MDEPTAGLDPVIRTEFLGMLSELIQDERKSVLLSSHITSDLERIADYVTFLHKGEVVFSATKDEILENWGIVKGGSDLLDRGARSLFEGLHIGDFGFEALTSRVSEARRFFGERAVIDRASLEDIMFFVAKSNHVSMGSGKDVDRR
jgi:ABC-2 type transport system ATP-binding protein